MSNAIEVKELKKAFGTQQVLDGIDFAVPKGSVFCLLGPNGAGKTTTVRILSTLLQLDSGEATVAGHNVQREPKRVRASIGLTGQFSAVDAALTGVGNLRMIGKLLHLKRADIQSASRRLLEQFDLVDAADKPVSAYSGGMKRRLDLAMSLMGKPQVIFLDEPTTGLDPRSRRSMWETVRELVAGGVTILLTTQYLEEADELADDVAVLNKGRIVAHGTPTELKRNVGSGRVSVQFATPEAFSLARNRLPNAEAVEDTLELRVPNDGSLKAVKQFLDSFGDDDIAVDSLNIESPTLDDVFLSLTDAGGELS